MFSMYKILVCSFIPKKNEHVSNWVVMKKSPSTSWPSRPGPSDARAPVRGGWNHFNVGIPNLYLTRHHLVVVIHLNRIFPSKPSSCWGFHEIGLPQVLIRFKIDSPWTIQRSRGTPWSVESPMYGYSMTLRYIGWEYHYCNCLESAQPGCAEAASTPKQIATCGRAACKNYDVSRIRKKSWVISSHKCQTRISLGDEHLPLFQQGRSTRCCQENDQRSKSGDSILRWRFSKIF